MSKGKTSLKPFLELLRTSNPQSTHHQINWTLARMVTSSDSHDSNQLKLGLRRPLPRALPRSLHGPFLDLPRSGCRGDTALGKTHALLTLQIVPPSLPAPVFDPAVSFGLTAPRRGKPRFRMTASEHCWLVFCGRDKRGIRGKM